jgi:uncharacterized membrane protein
MAAENTPRSSSSSTPEIEENVEAIKAWDRALLLKRSGTQRISDVMTSAAASGASMLGHAIWFIAWIAINTRLIPGLEPFDPFPFQLLTMLVSLEAIFLALFVLATQNRLGKQADLRANLDLQIDLLAEREMTAVLQLLTEIAGHLNVPTSVTTDQLADLVKKTDIKAIADEVDR